MCVVARGKGDGEAIGGLGEEKGAGGAGDAVDAGGAGAVCAPLMAGTER